MIKAGLLRSLHRVQYSGDGELPKNVATRECAFVYLCVYRPKRREQMGRSGRVWTVEADMGGRTCMLSLLIDCT